MEEREVIVYTTPNCPWCSAVKQYLQERGIPYTEIDVSQDQEAATEMIRKSGQMGVPVVEIGGEIVIGFDKDRLDHLLGLH
jgi:glutaredoxin-like YruB-family protein